MRWIRLVGGLVGWLVGWVGGWVGGLGWLVGWLVGWVGGWVGNSIYLKSLFFWKSTPANGIRNEMKREH